MRFRTWSAALIALAPTAVPMKSIWISRATASSKSRSLYLADFQSDNRLGLHFSRRALIDAGLLSSSTTELVLFANLTTGVQIVAHIPVASLR